MSTYPKSEKVDKRRHEAQDRDETHDRYITERISVEFETRWFRKEHGTNQRALRCQKTSSHYNRQCDAFVIISILWTASSNDLGSTEKEMLRNIRVDR